MTQSLVNNHVQSDMFLPDESTVSNESSSMLRTISPTDRIRKKSQKDDKKRPLKSSIDFSDHDGVSISKNAKDFFERKSTIDEEPDKNENTTGITKETGDSKTLTDEVANGGSSTLTKDHGVEKTYIFTVEETVGI